MTEAEKTSILEWMDKQIEINKDLTEFEDLNDKIKSCPGHEDGEIQMYKGIKKISEAADSELLWRGKEEGRNSEFYFDYKGFTFFELGTLSPSGD